MSEHEDGGPAFPQLTDYIVDGVPVAITDPKQPGMTLRDYFAAKALVLFSDVVVLKALSDSTKGAEVEDVIARSCYAQADAMLKARDQSRP